MGNVTIYDENVEWVFSTAAGSLNSADNSNPHTGLIDLAATAAHSGDTGTWTSAVTYNPQYYSSLSLWLDPTGPWALPTSGVTFFFVDSGGNQQGNAIEVMNGVFGFNAANQVYQNVVIPLSTFAIPAGVLIKGLSMIVATKTTLTFTLDTISLIAIPVVMPQTCNLDTLSATTQPWGYLDPKTVLGIQVGLMCDTLNGIDPTSELDPIALRLRLNCFARLNEAQLMGIWAVLWSQFLKIMATGGTSQIVNYVNNPNTEGVVPPNPTFGALAYPWNNPLGGTTFQWIVSQQKWV